MEHKRSKNIGRAHVQISGVGRLTESSHSPEGKGQKTREIRVIFKVIKKSSSPCLIKNGTVQADDSLLS